MSVSESLLIATFCITIVFIVLIALFTIIRLFSYILSFSSNKKPYPVLDQKVTNLELDDELFSSGLLKLKNVDEPTAAMIMAIVSDESGIPLSELCFKSIRLVEKQS
jgi:hypothetical protein